MWALMWASSSSFLMSVCTMSLSSDRRQIRLETDLHTLSISKSRPNLLRMFRTKRQCSVTWSPCVEWDRAVVVIFGVSVCVVIVKGLVLIGLMSIWLSSHPWDTWPELCWILLLIYRLPFLGVWSVVPFTNMPLSTDIFFMCEENE